MSDAYINLDTSEIITSQTKGYINCDEKIAKIILLLNKKGYITTNSCAGHIDKLLYYDEIIPINAKDFLDKNKELEIIRKNENEIIYRGIAWEGSNFYIAFKDEYKFPSLPQGFLLEDGLIIRKEFKLEDECGNKYTLKELKEIQDSSILELLNWVENLNINE